MGNIKSNPTYRANLGYNGFDMSMSNKFTSTTGELIPVYYDILQPGDKVSISAQIKTRTMPLASAAMANITEHVEYFFVPMEQIFKPFGSWFYGVNDFGSSLFDLSQGSIFMIPYIQPSTIYEISNTSDSSTLDMFGYTSYSRLLYMFNFPFYTMRDESDFASLCPILFCAYQKVFNDFYRLDDRINPDYDSFNLDKYYRNVIISASDAKKMLTLRYRPKRKDFFTNTFVSPLFNSESFSGYGGQFDLTQSLSQWLVGGLSYNVVNPDGVDIMSNGSVDTSSVFPDKSVISSATDVTKFLSPTAIRSSFALQKLLEVTRRAGKTYDAQTLAHFGVNVPSGIDGRVYYLGANHSEIKIGDVIATSDGTASSGGVSSTSVLGQVAGKGYGFSTGEKINFEAKCHGVFLAIYSCEVDSYYPAGSLDKLNQMMDPSSWYRPEFDNLGMQPLFGYQYIYTEPRKYHILGWQYRFSEFKTKFDQVHGGFVDNDSGEVGSLAYWVPAVDTFNNFLGSIQSYYVSPNSLDKIMLVGYSPLSSNYAKLYNTDPLLHDIYFDCKKASKMSTYGLESL